MTEGQRGWSATVTGRRWVELLGCLENSAELCQVIQRYVIAHLDPPLGGQHWGTCLFPAVNGVLGDTWELFQLVGLWKGHWNEIKYVFGGEVLLGLEEGCMVALYGIIELLWEPVGHAGVP